MKRTLFAATLLMAFPLPGAALSAHVPETAGIVRNSAGAATIERGGELLTAAVGTRLHPGDTLVTGPDGSLGVIFRDNSTLSLGPGSRLVLQEFLFSPADGKIGLLARLTRGTMAYLSGLIAKLSPESARFETPVASIGIRGTRFAVRVDE